MQTHNNDQSAPWYRQFWLWFVLAPPMASIVLGLSLLTTAIINSDSVVIDDYARMGKAIHKTMAREELAATMGLEARLHLSAEGVSAVLQGLGALPEKLNLRLSHPTHAERDHDLELALNAAGVYQAPADLTAPGRWYVQLEPLDGQWRLSGEVAHGTRELSLRPRRTALN